MKKIDKLSIIKVKNLCLAKDTIKKMKKKNKLQIGGKPFKKYTFDKGFIYRIII